MERLMHYVWQYRLLTPEALSTVDGRKVCVIDPGLYNTGAGPDFFNAKVRIDGRVWAGDVEMHLRATDWHRHGHDGDPAYDSVVLHVVDCDDAPVKRRNGEVIPQMLMRCAPQLHDHYMALVGRSDIDLPCAQSIASMPTLHMNAWLTSLAYERMYAKSDALLEILDSYTGDWEQAAYQLLARGLGFGTNADPMQRLARSLPLPFLRKVSDSVTAVEAMMFGQAGLLPAQECAPDGYCATLAREYAFMAHKFTLRPLESAGWKTGRIRPQNQPHRRIAALATFVTDRRRLVSGMLEAESVEHLITFFMAPSSPYWAGHYSFGTPAPGHPAGALLSRSSAVVLAINVAIPLMVAYGTRHGDEDMVQRAMEWLTAMPAESNSIIGMFGRAGIGARDAFTTQALLQLRRRYCEPHRCLYCRIGHRLLSRRSQRQ